MILSVLVYDRESLSVDIVCVYEVCPSVCLCLVTQGMKVIASDTCAFAKLESFYCVVCANVVKPSLSSRFFTGVFEGIRDPMERNRASISSSRCERATVSLARGHDSV